MSDQAGAEAWSYDALGRVLADRRTTSGVTRTFTYAYNLDGSVKSLTYPSGRRIDYAYNAAARTLSAVDAANSVNYAVSASYAPHGALASLQNGASLVSTFFYNNRLQPCRISVKSSGSAPANCASTTVGNVLDFTYSFDSDPGTGVANNGNVASIANNRDTARTQSFTYDELNRVKTAQSQATSGTHCWGLSFGYDIWANLLSASVTKCSAPTLSVGVNTKNQINNTGFGYDAAGNLTADGSLSMSYDAENRMLSTNAGVGYTYDGDGKRVAKSNGKLYWYGMMADVPLETNATGGTINEYVFFGGRRIARRNSSGTVFFYVQDHLGTSRAMLTVGSLAPCYEADYYPFGGERVITNNCPQDYKFTGKERDTETGLDFFIARYYSFGYGRFASPDPENAGATLDDPSSWNAYTYVTNNPLRYVDPFGLARVNERGEWEGESHGEKDCSTNNGCLYWNDDANEWQHEPPPSRDPRSSMLDGVASDPQMTTLYSVNDNYISPAFLNMMSLLPLGRMVSFSLSRSVVREGGKGAGKILGRGSTGRTVARNLKEQLAMEQAMSNPAAGKQLTNIVMGDKRWHASEGWVKMEQNINGVKIHYVMNTITRAVDDFKFVK